MAFRWIPLGVFLLFLIPGVVPADVVFENARMKAVIGTDGRWVSLTDKASGRECVRQEAGVAVADVVVGRKTRPAVSVVRWADGVAVRFEGVDTEVRYRVEPGDSWVVFRLVEIRGSRPERMTLLRLPPAIVDSVGQRLNAAYDDRTCVCLMAANRQPDCGARTGKAPLLIATTQDSPGPRMEGCAVALIVCRTAEFREIARRASHAFGMLTNEDANGVPVKDTDLVRGSYFFLAFGEEDVDRVIDACRRTGIRQVMMNSGSWCSKVGHYVFNEQRFPDGVDGLKRVVDRLHSEGILVGMHTFVSKISKTDPYVTPVPDKRFWRRFEDVLAEGVSPEQSEIRVTGPLREWAGCPEASSRYWEGGVRKHREVLLDDEIIQYESIGPEGVWNTFRGCRRGAWGTTAKAHEAGTAAVHYGVDGCINGYIIDQETDLMGEVADRIAGIFNFCGFDMVYFDGGEDVDRRRYLYYVSNFQEQALRRFSKRPILHMGTIMTHRLWHSFARSSTVDTYLNTLNGAIVAGNPPAKWPTVKEHINRSVRYMLRVRKSMVPGELGWFGIWPKRANTDGLQLDEMEYLMCKSLGYDVPVSLQTSFGSMEAHPLTPELLAIFRQYEETRMRRGVPEDVRARLQEMDRDFVMVLYEGERRFVEVSEVPLVGGTRNVRAFVGALGEGSVATMWHYLRDGAVTLAVDPARARFSTLAGEPVPFKRGAGRIVVPVGSRRHTLVCEGVDSGALRQALERADVWERPPLMAFLRAGDLTQVEGEMALGSTAGVREEGAFGDVLVCTGQPSPGTVNHWYAEYGFDVPRDGTYALWARVRYPSGGDDSFAVIRPGDEVTLKSDQVLGNCGVNEKRWHWTGRGGGSTTVPPGQRVTFKLTKGAFFFRVYAREGPGTVAGNPRLDLLCLTDDPLTVPTDDDVRRWLAGESAGGKQ